MSTVTESDREMAQRIVASMLNTDPATTSGQMVDLIAAALAAVREEGHIAGLRRAEEICVARMLNDDAQLTFMDEIREEINRRVKP